MTTPELYVVSDRLWFKRDLLLIERVEEDPAFGGGVRLDLRSLIDGQGSQTAIAFAMEHCEIAGPPRIYNRRGRRPPFGCIYVGRPTKWGNPFREVDEGSRAGAIARFERWLLEERPDLVQAAKIELRGRDLSCWCTPLACHADVLLRIANGR